MQESKYLLLTRYPILKGTDVESLAIKGQNFFVDLNREELITLTPVDGIDTIQEMPNLFTDPHIRTLSEYMTGDARREVLVFVEAVKPLVEQGINDSKYLQLRYIEVPPKVYEEYLTWRKETIFKVVSSSPEINFFLAYHATLTNQPGVMFISGFSVKTEEYSAVFSSEIYQKIVKEAGSKYISGGESKLYTKIFERLC